MVDSPVALIRAPNPSPMTLTGTNTYLLDCGDGTAICIDPGPAIREHLDAIVARAASMECRIVMTCLTHGHPDHAPGAQELKKIAGAPIAAARRCTAQHDRSLHEGDTVRCGGLELRVLETPGHSSDHLVFYDPRAAALFTGDTVLGEGYVVIAPPDGDMRAYQRSLQRLLDEFSQAATIFPGHGEPVTKPQAKLREYIDHRRERERSILRALRANPKTIPELLTEIYGDTDRRLWDAAARQIQAYISALLREEQIVAVATGDGATAYRAA